MRKDSPECISPWITSNSEVTVNQELLKRMVILFKGLGAFVIGLRLRDRCYVLHRQHDRKRRPFAHGAGDVDASVMVFDDSTS
jgi:hypothetical protein